MNKKISMLLIVIGICVLSISSVSAFLGVGEDIVEVIDVGLYPNFSVDTATASAISEKQFDYETYNTDVPATYEQWGEFEVKTDEGVSSEDPLGMNDLSSNDNFDAELGILINLKAKDTVKDVTTTKIQNLEITYGDGSVQKIGNFTFDKNNTYREYVKDNNYSLPCIYVFDQSLWNGSTSFSEFCNNAHIKGDIVVDTSSESNKVIGHLDNDVNNYIK